MILICPHPFLTNPNLKNPDHFKSKSFISKKALNRILFLDQVQPLVLGQVLVLDQILDQILALKQLLDLEQILDQVLVWTKSWTRS